MARAASAAVRSSRRANVSRNDAANVSGNGRPPVSATTVRAARESTAAHHRPVARTVIVEVLPQRIELLYALANPEASVTAGMRPGKQRRGRVKDRGGNFDGSVLHPRHGGRRFKG